jgi:RNA polymerase sigma factor (sigma-70 family)
MAYSQEFIELLRRQDPKTFEKLYNETADQFFRYCKTYYFLEEDEIDDLIGDFYVKLWSILTTLKSDYNLQAFLRTMFKNSCKDYFKKRKERYGTGEQLQEWS